MSRIGYHASHEQHAPGDLLALAQSATQAGFDGIMSSDHFMPWSEAQGHSGHVWSWLGAALQATRVPVGAIVIPGYRHHPAMVAQAAATLAGMFPGRFWMAMGSGERLNEHIVGNRWPVKAERNARLKECADVMRALWAGETVTHHGLVTVEEAKLYDRPPEPLPIYGAAITTATAEWVGGWADGLLTVTQPKAQLQKVIEAFRRGGGEGKPMILQTKVGYAKSEAEARRGSHEQWRTVIMKSHVLAELRMPADFDGAAEFVRPEDLDGHVRVSTDLARHAAWLQEDLELGFETLYVHNVHKEQARFIEDFGARVLPQVGK